MKPMRDKPRVFISYSHDSVEHKRWVATLATHLTERSLEVILDQWHLHYGGEINRFMERGIREADRVVMICSDNYVEKAMKGIRGVGYEGMIVTAELFRDLDTNKFIPVIVNQREEIRLPPFLGTRLYIDFRDPTQHNSRLAELVNDIHQLHAVEPGESATKPITPTQPTISNTVSFQNIGALIFAAGKSIRMQSRKSKMVEPVFHNGVSKPMLVHTVDLYLSLGLKVLILVGFEGDSVIDTVNNAIRNASVDFLRVAANDGGDLEKNTGGTLRKHAREIWDRLSKFHHILLSVGDQPHMHKQTLRDFLFHYLNECLDACILTAYARGTELEKCSSTRVSIVASGMEFNTPPQRMPFNFQSFSPLLDVGVVVIKSALFEEAAEKLKPDEVFGLIMRHVKKVGNFEEFREPEQFLNLNEPIWGSQGGIIQSWLEWNVDHNRKGGLFDLFSFGAQYEPEFEMDTTLRCSTTPACAHDCTYRMKHQNRYLNEEIGMYIVEKAKSIGFSGVLFSGGGENLEPPAYELFMRLLRRAKTAKLRTHLATNGLYINDSNVHEIVENLDSVRFSIACKADLAVGIDLFPPVIKFSHLGVLGENICKVRRAVDSARLSTQLWANVLMSAGMHMDDLKATILMLSQLGLDGVRLKAKHIYSEGAFHLDPKLFERHVQEIEDVRNCGQILPEITISKVDRLLREESGHIKPTHCWYGDFNPLVVGCDGHNYSCCEMKYEKSFECGQIDPTLDNLEKVLTNGRPQMILEHRCFDGCKGTLINQDLQYLLDEYRRGNKRPWELPENKPIHDRVLKGIRRSSFYN